MSIVNQNSSANLPLNLDGTVYHLGLSKGQVRNKILTVGDPDRAARLSKFMNQPQKYSSHRGFVCYSDDQISIVSIGMGYPMMDLFVREVSLLVEGEVFILRFGSCGSLSTHLKVGDLFIPSEGSRLMIKNCSAFSPEEFHSDKKTQNQLIGWMSNQEKYLLSSLCLPNTDLTQKLLNFLNSEKIDVQTGRNLTCDSFYSSQGRTFPNDTFNDHNHDLLSSLFQMDPLLKTMEMETFQLFNLSKMSPNIKSTSLQMVFANRIENEFISGDKVPALETSIGKLLISFLKDL